MDTVCKQCTPDAADAPDTLLRASDRRQSPASLGSYANGRATRRCLNACARTSIQRLLRRRQQQLCDRVNVCITPGRDHHHHHHIHQHHLVCKSTAANKEHPPWHARVCYYTFTHKTHTHTQTTASKNHFECGAHEYLFEYASIPHTTHKIRRVAQLSIKMRNLLIFSTPRFG